MAIFKRNLEQSIIDGLKESELWKKCLQDDCKKCKEKPKDEHGVFLAIRENNIGFYHNGGRLFHFDGINGFKTHIKYAAVIDDTEEEKNYLTEVELKNMKLIPDFTTKYKRIKENCKNYSRVEAQGVSEIYHKYSYLSGEDVVVLDIEISFEALDKQKGSRQDRIDILLLKKSTQTLKFVEAKHFSNSEIWSEDTPKVINQIKKYESQIISKKTEIIEAYKNYINAVNEIFKDVIPHPLPEPEIVEDKVAFLIFGFDVDQKAGRLKELILENDSFYNVKSYVKGDITSISLETFWNQTS